MIPLVPKPSSAPSATRVAQPAFAQVPPGIQFHPTPIMQPNLQCLLNSPKWNRLCLGLARHRGGRALLHLSAFTLSWKNPGWHLRGILRELRTCPGSQMPRPQNSSGSVQANDNGGMSCDSPRGRLRGCEPMRNVVSNEIQTAVSTRKRRRKPVVGFVSFASWL